MAELYPYMKTNTDVKFCFESLCNYTVVEDQKSCILKVISSVNDSSCSHCNQPRCNSLSYPTSHIALKYFTDQLSVETFAYSYLYKDHSSLNDMVSEYGGFNNVPASFIPENYILVNIFFNNFRLTAKKATAAMNSSGLISSVGGALGLWAGFSILTLVEVMEWLTRSLTLICFKEKVEAKSDKE